MYLFCLSNAAISVCPGFKYATRSYATSKECLIMTGDFNSSLHTGRSDNSLGFCLFSFEWVPWYAANEKFPGPLITCVDFTCSSKLQSAFRESSDN